jgi:glycosyltransferase involved in cell wall biosynthesis
MFTVVIPVYNHRDYVVQAIRSTLTSPLVTEVLVADDGSQDGSDRWVAMLGAGGASPVRDLTPWPRINRGAPACLNALCENAQNEWIAVLNSDDYFLPGRFEIVSRLIRCTECDFVFGQLLIVDSDDKSLGVKNGPLSPEYPFPGEFDVSGMMAERRWAALLANQNFVATTGNMVFRKSLWQRIGGFAPYRYVHDWHFALHAALLGRVEFAPHPLTVYRVHASNTIKESEDRVNAETTDLFARFAERYPTVESDPAFQLGMRQNRHVIAERELAAA